MLTNKRLRFQDNQNQKEARWAGMGEPRPTPPTRGGVRLMSDAEIQRQKDRRAGIVRILPRGRR